MFKQSIFLIITPVVLGLSTGIANANEIEVKAGNTRVSVQSGKVEIDRPSAVKTPSLLDRLSNLRLFGNRSSSSSTSNRKCDRNSSGYSSTRSNSSGTAVSQTSSSSTTMTCN